MKVEIDFDDLMTIAIAAIVIVALFTVPGCIRDDMKFKESQRQESRP